MPIGIIVNCSAVAIGGLAGSLIGDRIPEDFRDNLNMIFGISSMGMGVASIVLMKNMPAVILALILGTCIGMLVHLGSLIRSGAASAQKLAGMSGSSDSAMLLTVIVLFCASGTGIYGSLVSGMNGDHSILLAKSILDFFTALIFACSLGKVVSLIAIPQACIMLLLYFGAGFIVPLTTADMINDFKACGGFIMLATGFNILKLKTFPTADMIPSMILVMPFSWMWMTFILPFVS